MGWLLLALLAVAAMAALVLLRIGRPLWTLAGAALMLGAAGYVLQGSPTQPASPAVPAPPATADDAEMIALRARMLGRFTADDAYLFAADALARSGDRHGAAQVLAAGTRAMPRSFALWTALGSALVAHDGNTVSPPAAFAFQEAQRLAPRHPGPLFFLGAAYVRAGDFAAAQAAWHQALALTPAQADYRGEVAERVALIDRFIANAR